MTPPTSPNPEDPTATDPPDPIASSPLDTAAPDPREERIGALLNEFFDRRQSGENLSEEVFLTQYPDVAEELRAHLTGLDLLQGLGSSSDATEVVVRRAAPGSSSRRESSAAATALPEIPGYQVLREIGRGGMGIVFKAVQRSTKRVVALKLLLEGPFASEPARRRFEREIALAAQLRHPRIIPIYDSGTANGCMYFAMEHVFGMPLGEYARTQLLGIRRKVELFIRVCEPIAHAHMRGVIHRDLKPSNVLVDGDGEPHVLDFGLARSGSIIDSATSISAQIVGTLAYMSPEQAAGDPTGVDTRADVYALGVILYELVTGGMPYVTDAAIGKVLHNITHAEPTPPDKVKAARGAGRSAAGAARVDSELAAIILKALEKRKEDRYQTVDALTGDLRRYLSGEPITAKPAGSWYLIRKVAWRHKTLLSATAAAVLLTATLVGVVGHFSRKLERKAAELEVRAVAVDQSKQELERKQAEIERAAEEQESARRAYELLKQNLPPDLQKQFDTLVTTLGKSSARPEQLGAQLLVEALASQLEAESATPSIKESPIDPNAPLVSRRPDWVEPAPSSRAPSGDQAVIDKLRRLAGVLVAGVPAPTSQPTTSAAPDTVKEDIEDTDLNDNEDSVDESDAARKAVTEP